jgi:hypothetical protein
VKKNDEFHQVGVGLLPEWLLAPSASYSARKRSRVRARRPRAHCAADCSDSVRPERFRRSRPRGHVFPGSTDFAEVALICSRSFSTGNGQLRNRYRPQGCTHDKAHQISALDRSLTIRSSARPMQILFASRPRFLREDAFLSLPALVRRVMLNQQS